MQWSIAFEVNHNRSRLSGTWQAVSLVRAVALLLLAFLGLAALCLQHNSHDRAHQRLEFVADPRAGEAYVTVLNQAASVTWEWGSIHHDVQAEVLVNTVLANSQPVQMLRLRVDGTDLVLMGRSGLFSCTAGCDVLHLPQEWTFHRDP